MRKSAPLFCALLLSLSARRAWIEIAWLRRPAGRSGSISARRAWIEITFFRALLAVVASLSARRAWIEIRDARKSAWLAGVALRKESVDRNRYLGIKTDPLDVALRKESVDRNRGGDTHANRYYVALRKESVDRNADRLGGQPHRQSRSPQGERG